MRNNMPSRKKHPLANNNNVNETYENTPEGLHKKFINILITTATEFKPELPPDCEFQQTYEQFKNKFENLNEEKLYQEKEKHEKALNEIVAVMVQEGQGANQETKNDYLRKQIPYALAQLNYNIKLARKEKNSSEIVKKLKKEIIYTFYSLHKYALEAGDLILAHNVAAIARANMLALNNLTDELMDIGCKIDLFVLKFSIKYFDENIFNNQVGALLAIAEPTFNFLNKNHSFDNIKNMLFLMLYNGLLVARKTYNEEKLEFKKKLMVLARPLIAFRQAIHVYKEIDHNKLSYNEKMDLKYSFELVKNFTLSIIKKLQELIFKDGKQDYFEKRKYYKAIQANVAFLSDIIMTCVGKGIFLVENPELFVVQLNKSYQDFLDAADFVGNVQKQKQADEQFHLLLKQEIKSNKKTAKTTISQTNVANLVPSVENNQQIEIETANQKKPNKKLSEKNTVEKRYEAACELVWKKDYENAQKAFHEILMELKNKKLEFSIKCWVAMAECYYYIGLAKVEKKIFTRCYNKKRPVSQEIKSNTQYALNCFTEALKACEAAKNLCNSKISDPQTYLFITEWVSSMVENSINELNKDRQNYLNLMKEYKDFLIGINKWGYTGREKSETARGVMFCKACEGIMEQLAFQAKGLEYEAAQSLQKIEEMVGANTIRENKTKDFGGRINQIARLQTTADTLYDYYSTSAVPIRLAGILTEQGKILNRRTQEDEIEHLKQRLNIY